MEPVTREVLHSLADSTSAAELDGFFHQIREMDYTPALSHDDSTPNNNNHNRFDSDRNNAINTVEDIPMVPHPPSLLTPAGEDLEPGWREEVERMGLSCPADVPHRVGESNMHSVPPITSWRMPGHSVADVLQMVDCVVRNRELVPVFVIHPAIIKREFCHLDVLLKLSICALGAVMLGWPSKVWYYDQARSLAMQAIDDPSLQSLQSFILLCYCSQWLRNISAIWMYSSMSGRLAYLLNLHDESQSWLTDGSGMDLVDQETRRRCWWACYLLDLFLSSVLLRPPLVKKEHVQLLCSEEDWLGMLNDVEDSPTALTSTSNTVPTTTTGVPTARGNSLSAPPDAGTPTSFNSTSDQSSNNNYNTNNIRNANTFRRDNHSHYINPLVRLEELYADIFRFRKAMRAEQNEKNRDTERWESELHRLDEALDAWWRRLPKSFKIPITGTRADVNDRGEFGGFGFEGDDVEEVYYTYEGEEVERGIEAWLIAKLEERDGVFPWGLLMMNAQYLAISCILHLVRIYYLVDVEGDHIRSGSEGAGGDNGFQSPRRNWLVLLSESSPQIRGRFRQSFRRIRDASIQLAQINVVISRHRPSVPVVMPIFYVNAVFFSSYALAFVAADSGRYGSRPDATRYKRFKMWLRMNMRTVRATDARFDELMNKMVDSIPDPEDNDVVSRSRDDGGVGDQAAGRETEMRSDGGGFVSDEAGLMTATLASRGSTLPRTRGTPGFRGGIAMGKTLNESGHSSGSSSNTLTLPSNEMSSGRGVAMSRTTGSNSGVDIAAGRTMSTGGSNATLVPGTLGRTESPSTVGGGAVDEVFGPSSGTRKGSGTGSSSSATGGGGGGGDEPVRILADMMNDLHVEANMVISTINGKTG
ncbi:hypothetical protein HDU76_008021 [Blyttiomyces sp. JEL0837]|nr:hypothetical protein HDU76_008021 [Blyttiomyces sp. JEL0837]